MSKGRKAPGAGFLVIRTASHTDQRHHLACESRVFGFDGGTNPLENAAARIAALRAAHDWMLFAQKHENPSGDEFAIVEVFTLAQVDRMIASCEPDEAFAPDGAADGAEERPRQR